MGGWLYWCGVCSIILMLLLESIDVFPQRSLLSLSMTLRSIRALLARKAMARSRQFWRILQEVERNCRLPATRTELLPGSIHHCKKVGSEYYSMTSSTSLFEIYIAPVKEIDWSELLSTLHDETTIVQNELSPIIYRMEAKRGWETEAAAGGG